MSQEDKTQQDEKTNEQALKDDVNQIKEKYGVEGFDVEVKKQ